MARGLAATVSNIQVMFAGIKFAGIKSVKNAGCEPEAEESTVKGMSCLTTDST